MGDIGGLRFKILYWWYVFTGRLHDKWDVWRRNYDEEGNRR